MSRLVETYHGIVAVVVAVLCLTGHPAAVIAGFFLVVSWVFIVERAVFRRVGTPRFWAFSVVITVLAGLLLGKNPATTLGLPFSYDGLMAGVFMNLRGFSLVTATVLLTRSVKPERFQGVTNRIGIENFNPAFSAALETLPRMRGALLSIWKEKRTSTVTALARLLLMATDLAQGPPLSRSRFFGVTGRRGSGKTALLKRLAKDAEARGLRTGGFFQKRIDDEAGRTVAYEVERWHGGQSLPLARGREAQGFEFDQSAFAAAAEWLFQDLREADLILIDEIGLLESRGEGHAPALLAVAAKKPGVTIVATLRKDKIADLAEWLGFDRDRILNLDKSGADWDAFITEVLETLA